MDQDRYDAQAFDRAFERDEAAKYNRRDDYTEEMVEAERAAMHFVGSRLRDVFVAAKTSRRAE